MKEGFKTMQFLDRLFRKKKNHTDEPGTPASSYSPEDNSPDVQDEELCAPSGESMPGYEEMERIISMKDMALAEKDRMISGLQEEISRLKAQIDWMKRQIFGKKSEQSSGIEMDGQLSMFTDGADVGTALLEDCIEEGKKITVDQYTRKTGTKKKQKATFEELLEGLPKRVENIPAREEEQICPGCGEKMEHLGWKKIRTEIVVVPARYEAVEYYAETLKCMHCSDDDVSMIVETCNVPAAVMPHSLASPSLIAHVGMMKYGLYAPNYRMEKYLLLYNVKISREAMANQLIYVAEHYYIVMYEWLHMELRERMIVNADETPGKVNHLKELAPLTDSRGNLLDRAVVDAEQKKLDQAAREDTTGNGMKNKKIYMWLYASRYATDKPIALYDYQPSRAGRCCEAFLGVDYSGYLVIDGYSGYNGLSSAVRCCCIAHFRRHWYDAVKIKGGKPDENDPAMRGFMFCNQLFLMERRIAHHDPEVRRSMREGLEKPLWDLFWSWQEGIEASGGSALYKALVYSRNQRSILENYMLDGNIPMTNAYAELQARSYATGRKNFLFHDSAQGARSAAVIMSLIETAKANGINPEAYLSQLLEHRLEYLDSPDRRKDFAPWSVRMRKACAIKNENSEAEPEGA